MAQYPPPAATSAGRPAEAPMKPGSWNLLLPAGALPDDALQRLIARRNPDAQVLHPPHEPDALDAWLDAVAPKNLNPRPQVLIVGTPPRVPWAVQLALAGRADVGRLPFDTPEPVRRYVDKLLRWESTALEERPPVLLVRSDLGNPGRQSLNQGWIRNLKSDLLSGLASGSGRPGSVEVLSSAAQDTLERLKLAAPALVLAHNPPEDPNHAILWPDAETQRRSLGALLLTPEDVLRGEDVPQTGAALVDGGVILLAGPNTAGADADTPMLAHFDADTLDARTMQANLPVDGSPFAAALPAALLSAETGPVAVIGHLGPTLDSSLDPTAVRVPGLDGLLASVLGDLLTGDPVGLANHRFQEALTRLNQTRPERQTEDIMRLRALAREDLARWVVLGDPAARLSGAYTVEASVFDDPFASVPQDEQQDEQQDDGSGVGGMVVENPRPPPDLTADPFAEVHADDLGSPVLHLAVDPRGQSYAVATEDGQVRRGDLSGGPLKLVMRHKEPVCTLTFGDDGGILSGSEEGSVAAEQSGGAPPQSMKGRGTPVVLFRRVSPSDLLLVQQDGDALLAAGGLAGVVRRAFTTSTVNHADVAGGRVALGLADGRVMLTRVGEREVEPLMSAQGAVDRVALSAEGLRLAVGAQDGTLTLWDLEARRQVDGWRLPRRPVQSLHLSRDGARLTALLAGAWLALGTSGGRCVVHKGLRASCKLTIVRPHPGAPERLALGFEDGAVWQWDLKQDAIRSVTAHTGRVSALAWTADGRLLSGGADHAVRILAPEDFTESVLPPGTPDVMERFGDPPSADPASDSSTPTLPTEPVPLEGVYCAALRAGTLVLGGKLGARVARDELGPVVDVHTAPILQLRLNADGSRALSVDELGDAAIWSTRGDPAPRTLRGIRSELIAAQLSDTGDDALIAYASGRVVHWRVAAPASSRALLMPDDKLLDAALSSDGAFVAATTGAARVWSASTGALIAELEQPENTFLSLAFRPGHPELVAGTFRGALQRWRVAPGGLTPLPAPHMEPAGKENPLTRLTFSPDGRLMTATRGEKDLVVWALDEGEAYVIPERAIGEPVFSAWPLDDGTLRILSEMGNLLHWDPRGVQPTTAVSKRLEPGRFGCDPALGVVIYDGDGATFHRFEDISSSATSFPREAALAMGFAEVSEAVAGSVPAASPGSEPAATSGLLGASSSAVSFAEDLDAASGAGDDDPDPVEVTEDRSSPTPVPTVAPVHVHMAPAVAPALPRARDRLLRLRVSLDRVELEVDGDVYTSANLLPAHAAELAQLIDPTRYGRALFGAVFHDTLPTGPDGLPLGHPDWTTRVGLLHALRDAPENTRIELLLSDDPEVRTPLWETLTPPQGDPITVRRATPISRRVHPGPDETGAPEPLRLLAAICDHPRLGETGQNAHAVLSQLTPLDVPHHRAVLDRGLTRLREAGLVQVTWVNDAAEPVTLDALSQALEEDHNALHLVCHGVFVNGSFRLVMPREGHRSPFVTPEELLDAVQGRLRMVVLAACDSARPGEESGFNPLGVQLAHKVPAVIAMQRPLSVEAAQLFAGHFYDDLARTGDPARALSATRRALRQFDQKRKLTNWGVPVLFTSTDLAQLFEGDRDAVDRLAPLAAPEAHLEHQRREIQRTLERHAPHLDAARVYQVLTTAGETPDTKHRPAPQDRAGIEAAVTAAVDLHRENLVGEDGFEVEGLEAFVARQDPPLIFDRRVYEQLCSALNARKHVVLIGPPGTGKTTLAHYACAYAQERGMTVGGLPTTATADWTTFDTIGGYLPGPDGGLRFRPGIFLRAITEGRWLVIDELNRAEIDKAIGELFTSIAGQAVELPYQVGGQPLRVLPPAGRALRGWDAHATSGYDLVIHPNWRILATMNVYDRSSLYAMSFAFMRRFAFVEVANPPYPDFCGLVDRWSRKLPDPEPVRERLCALIDPGSPLMQRRSMGPAILRDMLRYIEDRARFGVDPLTLVGESFLLYACSQLDGLDLDAATELHLELGRWLSGSSAAPEVLARLRSLYPAVQPEAWPKPPPSAQRLQDISPPSLPNPKP
ncbi:MAG: CHAT domain-containing protein [Alphaproteobacteria bacterium]|nr:CHAT domain-containing protein [Alphaproteobacteria bacterium]